MKVIEAILLGITSVLFVASTFLSGDNFKKKDLAYASGYLACATIDLIVFIRILFQ